MRLAYRGEGFAGWQIQPRQRTIQGVLEEVLGRLLRHPTGVTGAGRTDTGVNARMMVAHFDHDGCLPSNLVYALNSMVGHDIAVEEIWQVTDDAHARFDATERTYRYYVTTAKSPFLYPLSWQARPDLDFDAMNEAARLLIGKRDFTSFSKLHTQVKTNICDLRKAQWVRQSEDVWYFEISADRFLRNMVRAVVGTLVEIGRHKFPPSEITVILEAKNRCQAGTSMPGNALFLWEIKYAH